MRNKFSACAACANETPELCDACLDNRDLIGRLRRALEETLETTEGLCKTMWPTTAVPSSIVSRLAELRKDFEL